MLVRIANREDADQTASSEANREDPDQTASSLMILVYCFKFFLFGIMASLLTCWITLQEFGISLLIRGGFNM